MNIDGRKYPIFFDEYICDGIHVGDIAHVVQQDNGLVVVDYSINNKKLMGLFK